MSAHDALRMSQRSIVAVGLPPIVTHPAIPVVKICGLSTADSLGAAIEAGADRVGLVFFAPSPRHVSLATARGLADRARGAAEVVALSVDADDATLDAIVEAVRPAWLQLHGSESPERVAAVRRRFGIPVMKALGIAVAADLAEAARYRGVADALLLDAKPPRGSMLPGGNGAAFDWTILESFGGDYMLSGGLSPDNVGEALRMTGVRAVDVSSGVERAPGVKDEAKIRAFVAAAKSAALV